MSRLAGKQRTTTPSWVAWALVLGLLAIGFYRQAQESSTSSSVTPPTATQKTSADPELATVPQPSDSGSDASQRTPSATKSTGFSNPQFPTKPTPSTTSTSTKPVDARSLPGSAPPRSGVFQNVTIRNQDGGVIYRGEIDLKPTLERINRSERITRFPNDGTVFQNREGRLPRQSPGYYREWVHPTPGERGPGPQRVVTGDEGDIWYTPDHYQSFRRVTR